MRPVYAGLSDKSDILADMYAYSYAAIHHNVKHALFDQYMLSNVDIVPEAGEPWDWVADLNDMSCHTPGFPNGHLQPGFLHASTHYKACTKGDKTHYDMSQCGLPDSELWNFHKGHVPSEILGCHHPLLMPPPDDLFNVQVRSHSARGKLGAFMVCNMVFMINRAASEYKQQFCKPGFNAKKCTRLVVQQSGGKPFNATNPWKYPLAMIDRDCCPECEHLAMLHE